MKYEVLSSHIVDRLFELGSNIAKYIDQTLIKPDADEKAIRKFIETSDGCGFRSLVVPLIYSRLAVELSRTPITTIIAFPHGNIPLESKLHQIDYAASCGVKEVDVVANISLVKSGNWSAVRDEISKLVENAHSLGLGIKIIIETPLLTPEEIAYISKIITEAGADFIKTCTGFGPRGVTPSDVILIYESTRGKVKIKASGGIRCALDAITYLLLGASCIGTSSGIQIIRDMETLRKIFRETSATPSSP